MPKRDVDCSSQTTGPTIYAQRFPAIIDRALAMAGVAQEVRDQVQTSLDELKYADGQVIAVSTKKAERLISVSGPRDGSILATFAFPPNSGNFESELVRAQDTGRPVSVVYTEGKDGKNILEDVCIFAGAAAGNTPRY